MPPAAMAVGALALMVKIGVSTPALGTDAPMVVITWLVSASFVLVGWLLFGTGVPAVNGWGCLIVAAATIPGDFNAPAFSGSSQLRVWLASTGPAR